MRVVPTTLRCALALSVALLACAAIQAAEKPRLWQLGLMREMNAESWTSSSTAPVTCTYGSGCSGGGTSSWNHETFTLAISGGDQTYVVARTLSFRWQHDPKVTENSLMKFAVEGDHLILIGDDGREFKTHITKKRLNTVADQIQECSLITEVLSRRLSGFKDFDLILVVGRFAVCGSVGLRAKDVPLVQSVERSISLLLTEEESRLAKKAGAAPAASAFTATTDSCSRVWATAADRAGLAKVPEDSLLPMMRQAQACDAAQLDGPTGLPGSAASGAQMNLAAEGVTRLSGFTGTKN